MKQKIIWITFLYGVVFAFSRAEIKMKGVVRRGQPFLIFYTESDKNYLLQKP